jgi:long-chain acyl-CoA synthetase
MYTSGTTGPPKGVVLTHKNVIAAVAGVDKGLGATNTPGGVGEHDFLLCFLPLAHILEFVYELCSILWGGTIGYATVKTLTEASTRNCKGDIKEFRPTILVAIPAVWESIRKGIIGRVHGTGLKEKIFWGAFSAKSFLQRWHLPGTSVLNAIVFNKVKDATGGRLRLSLSGGAPLAVETQHFMTVCVATLLQGYGLTETAAYVPGKTI